MFSNNNHLDLSDRVIIECGIYAGHSFSVIADKIGKHPATVSREIRNNRTLLRGERPRGKDCSYAGECKYKNLCEEEYCDVRCSLCQKYDCRDICKHYHSNRCKKLDKKPYVCNTCNQRRYCKADRAYYSAQQADVTYKRRLSESREGIQISGEELQKLDKVISSLVKKGQSLTHIYAEHSEELRVSQRTLYNYIDEGVLSIKNIDLRRKTSYRPRKKKKAAKELGFANKAYRKGRTYDDYQTYMVKHPNIPVVEMDTVKGVREQGKRMLTIIFCNCNLMLIFLMKDGTADSVIQVFDYLTDRLGLETFKKIFPLILTDNGSEFKKVTDLENTMDGKQRTKIFYCDPQASWQKPHIEKNHEYIRYVIPRGKSFNRYTQDDMVLLMNHINSTRRAKLEYKSPFELTNSEEMKQLMTELNMHIIPPDNVHLLKNLLKH